MSLGEGHLQHTLQGVQAGACRVEWVTFSERNPMAGEGEVE